MSLFPTKWFKVTPKISHFFLSWHQDYYPSSREKLAGNTSAVLWCCFSKWWRKSFIFSPTASDDNNISGEIAENWRAVIFYLSDKNFLKTWLTKMLQTDWLVTWSVESYALKRIENDSNHDLQSFRQLEMFWNTQENVKKHSAWLRS